MSKKIDMELTCPQCNNQFNHDIYRTIWWEYPEYRELVFSNKINVVNCPNCNASIKVDSPFLFTNSPKQFAVRWEPEHNEWVDRQVEAFQAMWKESFLATAPRISDWEKFKDTIVKFENGELKWKPIVYGTEAMKNFFKNIKKIGGK